ncbi:hypothetical protein INT45_003014 [Circinella minor]|uniref:Uncharacterized protein n=1 Tax=Circinella minor TaxID=1195481 RepID=A0A8H7RX68_9FUNG|nr:hypothetical protein INT45_003014 [Circinella minor]
MYFTDSTNDVLSVEETRCHSNMRRHQGVSSNEADETEGSREEYEDESRDDANNGMVEPFGWGTSWQESYRDMLDSKSGVLGFNIEWIEVEKYINRWVLHGADGRDEKVYNPVRKSLSSQVGDTWIKSISSDSSSVGFPTGEN